MKITRKDYDTAKTSLGKLEPKLKNAKETVRQWDEAIASFGRSIDGLEVTEIEIDGSGPSFKGRRKDGVKDAAA